MILSAISIVAAKCPQLWQSCIRIFDNCMLWLKSYADLNWSQLNKIASIVARCDCNLCYHFILLKYCYTVQKMAASLTLDIGEDRILLETRSSVYRLDIYLPFLLVQDNCVAQFNRQRKVRSSGNVLPYANVTNFQYWYSDWFSAKCAMGIRFACHNLNSLPSCKIQMSLFQQHFTYTF